MGLLNKRAFRTKVTRGVVAKLKQKNYARVLENQTKRAVKALDVYDTGATLRSITAEQKVLPNGLSLSVTYGTDYAVYPHEGTSRYPQHGARKFLNLGGRYFLEEINARPIPNIDIGDKQPIYRKPKR